MDPNEDSGWRGQFKEAVKELNEITYVTKEQLELQKCADTEPWEPSSYVKELVPNIEDVEIEIISDKTDLNSLNKKLQSEKTVGLVVLGQVVHRKSKPDLIVITTKSKLYAIEPNDTSRGIQFLKLKLMDKSVHFWTSNGLNEADCLYHNYGIDLSRSSADCCTGAHIHMMRFMKYLPDAALLPYPPTAMQRCKSPIMIESFERLVEIWLDINKDEIHYEPVQVSHLSSRPLSLTAINVIKKRCTLLLPLVDSLTRYSWLECHMMSESTFNRLVVGNEETRRRLQDWMQQRRDSDEPDCGYYQHMNLGVSSG